MERRSDTHREAIAASPLVMGAAVSEKIAYRTLAQRSRDLPSVAGFMTRLFCRERFGLAGPQRIAGFLAFPTDHASRRLVVELTHWVVMFGTANHSSSHIGRLVVGHTGIALMAESPGIVVRRYPKGTQRRTATHRFSLHRRIPSLLSSNRRGPSLATRLDHLRSGLSQPVYNNPAPVFEDVAEIHNPFFFNWPGAA